MKKKLSIILACVMLAALVLGSVTIASADATVPVLSPTMSLTVLEDLSGASASNKCQAQLYSPTDATDTIVDDAAISGGKLKKIGFDTVTTWSYNGDAVIYSIAAYDGLVFRVKTEGTGAKVAPQVAGDTGNTTFFIKDVMLYGTNGSSTPLAAYSAGILYEIPANFDGYVAFSLDGGTLAAGAGAGTRNGNVISNGDSSATFDLTQFKHLALQAQFTADPTNTDSFYLGNLYGYTSTPITGEDGADEIQSTFDLFSDVEAIYNLAADVTNAAEVANVLTTAADGLTTDLAAGATQGYLAQYVVQSSASVCPYIKLADLETNDGIMFRLKTDYALSFWSIAHMSEGTVASHPSSFYLLALDGTVTVLPFNYQQTIPAGFDGYVMISFDRVTITSGGGIGSRLPDNTVVSDASWSLSGYDLSKLDKMQFAAWATTGSDANGTNSYYVGNAYLYKLANITDGAASLKALNSDFDTVTAINNVSKYGDAGHVPFIKNDRAHIGLSTDGNTVVHELRAAVDTSYYTYTGSLEGVDAVVVRYQTNADTTLVAFYSMSGRNTSFYFGKATLIALNGTKTDAEVANGYQISVPAGFDGYIMLEFDTVTFAGGVAGTRTGDTLSNADGSITCDLSKVKALNLQPCQADPNAVGPVSPQFGLGNAYLATLVEPTPSVEPSAPAASAPAATPSTGASAAPSAGTSATAGPGQNGANGAPLMIGVAIAALASASFVLKRKK